VSQFSDDVQVDEADGACHPVEHLPGGRLP
jgi:hypothetical protein